METRTADVESLYEAAYQAELRKWETESHNLATFGESDAYDSAAKADAFFYWGLVPFLVLVGILSPIAKPAEIGVFTAAMIALVSMVASSIAARSNLEHENYRGIGPFGRCALRDFSAHGNSDRPERLDPFSTEAMVQAIGYTRRTLKEEQDALLQRIWTTKIEAGGGDREGGGDPRTADADRRGRAAEEGSHRSPATDHRPSEGRRKRP